MNSKLAIIDYSAGNLRSVARALDFLNVPNEVTNDPEKVKKADAVIVPGVGAAGSAMSSLESEGLIEVLKEHIESDKPFLGICLGLQILFEKSEEDGADCLGIFPGKVKKFSAEGIKIPHIGWNPVDFSSASSGQVLAPKLLEGIKSGTPFYYVHSYIGQPDDESIVVASTTHGETFPSVINRGNTWGVQFHPEKSGKVGLTVLSNFAKIAALFNS